MLAFLIVALPGAATAASPAPSPTVVKVRAGIHPDFERLVFDWPRAVRYAVHREGAHVTIRFTAPARADFHEAASAQLARIRNLSSSASSEGRLTVSFVIDAHAVIKDFFSGTAVVIDVRGRAAPTASDKTVATAPPLSLPAQAATPPPASPATNVPAASPANPPAVSPSTSQTNALPSVIAAAPVLPSLAETAPPPEVPPPPAEAPPTKTQTAVDITPPAVSLPPAPASEKIEPLPDIGSSTQLVASLDPHIVARAVIYQRAGYAYIIFDRKFTLNLAAITADQPPPLVDLEPLELSRVSGWRFPVPADAEVRATRESTAWHIFLSKQHIEIPVSTALVAQPDFALGAPVSFAID